MTKVESVELTRAVTTVLLKARSRAASIEPDFVQHFVFEDNAGPSAGCFIRQARVTGLLEGFLDCRSFVLAALSRVV